MVYKRIKMILRSIEWVEHFGDVSIKNAKYYCPFCKNIKFMKHKKNCKLDKFLNS